MCPFVRNKNNVTSLLLLLHLVLQYKQWLKGHSTNTVVRACFMSFSTPPKNVILWIYFRNNLWILHCNVWLFTRSVMNVPLSLCTVVNSKWKKQFSWPWNNKNSLHFEFNVRFFTLSCQVSPLRRSKTNLDLHELEDLFFCLLKKSRAASTGCGRENIVHPRLLLRIQVDPWGNLIHGHLPLTLVLGHRLEWWAHKKNVGWGSHTAKDRVVQRMIN